MQFAFFFQMAGGELLILLRVIAMFVLYEILVYQRDFMSTFHSSLEAIFFHCLDGASG